MVNKKVLQTPSTITTSNLLLSLPHELSLPLPNPTSILSNQRKCWQFLTKQLQNVPMLYRVHTLPLQLLYWKMASWLTTWPPFTLAPSLSILALLVSLLTLLISKTLFFQGISFYFALKNVTFFFGSWDWSDLDRSLEDRSCFSFGLWDFCLMIFSTDICMRMLWFVATCLDKFSTFIDFLVDLVFHWFIFWKLFLVIYLFNLLVLSCYQEGLFLFVISFTVTNFMKLKVSWSC